MTKNWVDSYEKVLQRQENQRKEHKEKETRSRMTYYADLLERQRVEKERMLEEAREIFFKQKDEPKTLESALMCSEMLREQQVQRDFNKVVKQEEKEREKLNAQEINEGCSKWIDEQRLKLQRRVTHNIKESLVVKAQANERNKRILEEKQRETELEQQDYENGKREMEILKKFEQELKIKQRDALNKQIQGSIDLVLKRKEEEKKLDKMEDKLIKVYENANYRILQLRKQKEADMEEQRENRRLLLSHIPDLRAERSKKEDERNEKARIEKEEIEQKLLISKKAHREMLNADKRDQYAKWVQSEAQSRESEKALKTWELANSYQNIQNTEDFYVQIKDKRRLINLEHKEFILKQRREMKEKNEKEKTDLLNFYGKDRRADMEKADHKFLTYADNLIKECLSVNRPIYPIQKVILDYKARYLNPPRRLAQHLKTHFSNNEIDTGSNIQKPGKKFKNYSKPQEMKADVRTPTCCKCRTRNTNL